jgi:hypothetical protein
VTTFFLDFLWSSLWSLSNNSVVMTYLYAAHLNLEIRLGVWRMCTLTKSAESITSGLFPFCVLILLEIVSIFW